MSQGALYTQSLSPAIVQNVITDAGNSSTANLAALATFTGTGRSTLGIAGIQVCLKTDQNCIVYVDQSLDNSNWDLTDTFNYNKITNNFGMTVQAVSSYYRIRVKNLSSTTTTTYFRLGSALCPIVEAVPRALSDEGALRTEVYGLTDDDGHAVRISPMGAMHSAELFRLVGVGWGSAVDTNFWTAATSGGNSSAAVANGVATIASGTANSAYSQYSSVRIARFIIGHPHLFRGLIRIPTVVVAENTRRWGMYTVSTATPQNGAYFELSAAGVLSVVTCSGGTPSAVASGNFNGKLSEYTVDTNMHSYEITYLVSEVHFYIDGELIHTVTPTTAPISQTTNFNAIMTTVNSGSGTTSGIIENWLMGIFRIGKVNSAPITKYQSGTTAGVLWKSGPGLLHSLSIMGMAANNAAITIYDGTSTGGTVIFASGALNASQIHHLNYGDAGLPFYTGLFLVIATQNANVTGVIE